jgi:hypothetical protein
MRHWRLAAAAVWLLGCGALVLRGDGSLLAWAAGALAAWNLARWFQDVSRRATPAGPEPLRPDRSAPRRYEYNPEFDFQKQESPDRPAT